MRVRAAGERQGRPGLRPLMEEQTASRAQTENRRARARSLRIVRYLSPADHTVGSDLGELEKFLVLTDLLRDGLGVPCSDAQGLMSSKIKLVEAL